VREGGREGGRERGREGGREMWGWFLICAAFISCIID